LLDEPPAEFVAHVDSSVYAPRRFDRP